MGLKDIRAKKSLIQEEIGKLREQVELLENEEKALECSEILKYIQNTKWAIGNANDSQLYYIGNSKDNKDDEFETYVWNTMGLYPHGKSYIASNIIVASDDSTILLYAEPTSDDFDKIAAHSNIMLLSLLPFVKKHNLSVDFSRAKHRLDEKTQNLATELNDLEALTKKFGDMP